MSQLSPRGRVTLFFYFNIFFVQSIRSHTLIWQHLGAEEFILQNVAVLAVETVSLLP